MMWQCSYDADIKIDCIYNNIYYKVKLENLCSDNFSY